MPGVIARLIPWLIVFGLIFGVYKLCVVVFTKQRTPLQKARLVFFLILLMAIAIVVVITQLLPLLT